MSHSRPHTHGLMLHGWQVFLDAVESVNLLVNSNGTVVLSEVDGVEERHGF